MPLAKSRWRRPELDSLELNERILVEAHSPFVRPFDHVIPGDGRDYVFRFALEDVGTIQVIIA